MIAGRQDPLLRGAAVAAAAFGLLTIARGGYTLFGGAAARQAAGDYVPFVLWFNFVAGFVYVAAAVGLWRHARWAAGLALAIGIATLLVFGALGVHIARGGAYEPRTVAAMTLRSLVWLALAWLGWQRMTKRPRRAAAPLAR